MRQEKFPNLNISARIRFVSTAATYMDLQYQFHIHETTLCSTAMRQEKFPNFCTSASIRFVATAARYMDLQYQFHMHQTTLCSIIPEFCVGSLNFTWQIPWRWWVKLRWYTLECCLWIIKSTRYEKSFLEIWF